jgi:flagellar assembly protein FliH
MQSYSNIIKQNQVAGMDWVAVETRQARSDKLQSESVTASEMSAPESAKALKLREAMILERARMEARKIIDEACLSKEQALREGYEAGYSEGYSKGLDQAATEKKKALDLADRQMGDLLAAAASKLEALTRDYEGHLLKLSVQVASVFIKSHMTPEQMMGPLKEMLHELSLSAKIVVRMSPQDFKTLSGARDYFQEACPDSRLVMVEDATLSSGILQCETDSRRVDFDPGRHIEALLSDMLGVYYRQQELSGL